MARDAARHPPLRRLLTGVLIGVALIAFLLVGVATVIDARRLLTDRVEGRLATHFDGLSRTLATGVERLENEIALVATAGSTAEAIGALGAAVADLEAAPPPVPDARLAGLRDRYSRVRDEAAAVLDGAVPPVDALIPQDPATQWLQAQYVVADGSGATPSDDPGAADPGAEDRGGDDPGAEDPGGNDPQDEEVTAAEAAAQQYADVHARLHPVIVELRDALRFGDMLLLDATGRIVYSVEKRPDFGTDIRTGPWSESALADAVNRRLAETTVGEGVLVDFSQYLPAGGAPVMFAVASVSDGAEVIGAVAAEVPVAAIDAITTADGQWQEVGLGDTGETYLVGGDGLLRSDARLWLEEPEQFLGQLPSDQAAAVEAADTSVLQVGVDTEAVHAALDGDRYTGRSDNVLGESRLAVAGPVQASDLGWVLVADQGVAEAEAPLRAFTRWLLLLALVLLPLIVLASAALARALTRRVRPVVRTAAALAAGDLDAPAGTMRTDELEDVSRQLALLASELKAQQAERAAEDRAASEMLASVLPPRLIDDLQKGRTDLNALMDTATVVALTVHGPLEVTDLDADTAIELSARLSAAIEDLADANGLERVRSSSDQHLFVAGLGEPDTAPAAAAAFACDVPRVLAAFEEQTGVSAGFEAGIGTGDVAAVLFDQGDVTYSVFGAPIRVAMMLGAVAGDGRILVDDAVAERLGEGWGLVPADDLVDLRGDPIAAYLLTGRTGHAPAPQADGIPAG